MVLQQLGGTSAEPNAAPRIATVDVGSLAKHLPIEAFEVQEEQALLTVGDDWLEADRRERWADLVAACARHPLARAFRPGGLVLSALQELAMAYLRRDGQAIPFWRMAARSVDDLRTRAEALGVGDVVDLSSVPGGGTLPTIEIPSVGIRLDGDHTEALRSHTPPIIARVHEQRTLLDLRTVEPHDDEMIATAVRGLTP